MGIIKNATETAKSTVINYINQLSKILVKSKKNTILHAVIDRSEIEEIVENLKKKQSKRCMEDYCQYRKELVDHVKEEMEKEEAIAAILATLVSDKAAAS